MRKAATKKKDDRILLKILDKDCVAIEVKYHMKCYKNYTNFLFRQEKTQETCEGSSTPLYNAGYEQFCKEVVEDLVTNKNITYMSRLYRKFINVVKRVEGKDASNFRKFRLKERFIKSYPQLVFLTPTWRNLSEIVFVENLCTEDILKDGEHNYDISDDDNSDDDNNDDQIAGATQPTVNRNMLQVLYHASMMLKQKLSTVKGLVTPWPPLATNINDENVKEIVDPNFFKFFAWTLGFSDDAQMSSYVAVTDKQKSRINSLVQDMVLIESDGRKLTPKSISLAMAI